MFRLHSNLKVEPRHPLFHLACTRMTSQQPRPALPSSSTTQGLTHDPRPRTSHIHRMSTIAPSDAPPMNIRWFYATDVPKRRHIPDLNEKPKVPSKWTAFTSRDSKALELAFQRTITNPDEEAEPVLVNEDHLFEVNIVERELKPVYFRGSTYEVRRSGWFFQEGSLLKPCDEILATQIEEGYIKLKPFRTQATTTTNKEPPSPTTVSKDKPPTTSPSTQHKPKSSQGENTPSSRSSSPFRFPLSTTPTAPVETAKKEMVWKLLGEQHMGKYVIYTNATTAWLLSDDLYGKLTSSVYQTLTAGIHLGGAKLIRGYVEPIKPKVPDKDANESTTAKASGSNEDTTIDQVEGKEMEQDYDTNVNILRRTLKNTFTSSAELNILVNQEPSNTSKTPNCRVQVLPVLWRQEIQFGVSKENDGEKIIDERDIGDVSDDEGIPEDTANATLKDITVEGLAPIRTLISDVLLDILLYYTPNFRERIVHTVAREMNRIYNLFLKRNPTFRGRVSLLGHSLGSAICFDILCRQPLGKNQPVPKEFNLDPRLALDFDVHGFFAIGSPVGLFQMLKGRNIAARSVMEKRCIVNTPLGEEHKELVENVDAPVSCPKCDDMYNIFHPYDPIAYRVEPLISKKMAEVKPHPLPYTKGGLREQLVGLSGVGQRISSGASNLWSSVRSSIASSLISRSLGYTDVSPENPSPPQNDPSNPGLGIMPEDTLYSVFKQSTAGLRTARQEANKLKAINSTGRIDFVIQEGLFEASYLSAIAAHLQYWNDEDVAHFMLSQLLLGAQNSAVHKPLEKHESKPSQ